MQASCIICAEVFIGFNSVLSSRCGHIFHSTCITQWLTRSKSCPVCRSVIANKSSLIELHFNEVADEGNIITNNLLNEITKLSDQLKVKDKEIANVKDIAAKLKEKESEQKSLRDNLSINNLLKEITKLNNELKVKDKIIANVTNIAAKQKEKALEQKSLVDKIEQLQLEKNVQRKIIEKSNYMHLEDEETRLQLENELKALKAKLLKLEQEKATQRGEIERAKNKHLNDEERISQRETDLKSLRNKLQQLEKDKTSQREKFEQAKNVHLKDKEEISQLVTEQKFLRARLHQLEQHNEALREEIKKANYIHLKDKEELSQIVTEQKSLRAKHQLDLVKAARTEEIKRDHLNTEKTLFGLVPEQKSPRAIKEQVVTKLAATNEASSVAVNLLDEWTASLLSGQESLKAIVQNLEKENDLLKRQTKVFGDVHLMVWGSDEDIQRVIDKWGDGPDAVKHIAAYIPILKNELLRNIDARLELQTELDLLRKNRVSQSAESVPGTSCGTISPTSEKSADASKKRKLVDTSLLIQP